ncbi:MAG: 4-(cytidine 5'-diphospho)-2-C-methyl-D-erythritol kinase [Nitrospirae bacterium]|nr:4-(cytidine 5'-diphospho)-2-C-methyl-D-erythritol kinase [Nitrospirota bacterium]
MTPPPEFISIKTPAKINLLLHVKGKRADGYHDIVTVMQAIDLFDELLLEKGDKITFISDSPDVPSDENNLVYKAAVKLREFSRIKEGAKITLKKNIPVAAGLGGGSSDAAAVLSGLNYLWKLGLPFETLCGLGRDIGSDVPFFIGGPTAAGFGRGDELIQLSNETDYWYLLVNPGILISTAWVYGQIDISANDENNPPIPPLEKGGKGGFERISPGEKWIGPLVRPNLELTKADDHIKIFLPDGLRPEGNKIWLFPYNDLEGVVIRRYPVIKKIKDEMVASGAISALMSGSGSSVFGIFRDRDSVERAGRNLQHKEWRTWIVKALHSSPYQFVS